MRTFIHSLAAVTFVSLVGCGAPSNQPVTPPPSMASATTAPSQSPPAQAPTPTEDIDPVASGLSTDGVTKLCDEHLARATNLLDSIKQLEQAPIEQLTWNSTVGKYDTIILELTVAVGFPYLMGVGHPDKAIRDVAKTCEPKYETFRTNMMLDPTFAAVIKRYASRKEPLSGVQARLLSDLQRDFRRNGLELAPDGQKRLREINDELTKLSQEFTSNISDAVLSIKVKPEQLKGLPATFIDQHKPEADGLVTLTTNYPDYFPIVTYCEDRSVARALTEKFDDRAADKNMPILDKVLALRNEKAKLLGYSTWADYAIEPRMAKTASNVRTFLDNLSTELKQPAKREYDQFVAEYRRLGHKVQGPLPNYERLYIENKLRERNYGLDSKQLSEYLEVGEVTNGIFNIVERLYGIKFVPVVGAPKWHSDVTVYDVKDGSVILGRAYLDLFPREGKYKHAAMFDIRPGKSLPNGKYVQPIAALMCNFPKPGTSPALMTHNDVTTFFHEFGHLLHHLITRQPLAAYSGTSTARDFVETPSQMFEEWTFRREVLDLFAKHYKTGERIPEKLYTALVRSRAFGRALHTERQVSLASLDFVYHTKPTPFDTTLVFNDVMKRTQRFAYIPGTRFQATFGHLMGYDAGYYGYQWALDLAQDVLTRFEAEGFLNQKVAMDWRKMVLEQGAGEDENKLIENFLGRPHNINAYSKFLKGQ